jgi:hypothetical protein
MVLSLVLGVLYVRERARSHVPSPPPLASDPNQLIAGFAGSIPGHAGATLEVRLSRLHADSDRQRYDADALRARLGLPVGEPWRLAIAWRGPRESPPEVPLAPLENGAAEPTSDATAGPAEIPLVQDPQEEWGLGLGSLWIEDEGGVAMRAIPPDPDSPPDPLRTLLAPPEPALRPNQAVDLVLWGRAPKNLARLRGLLPEEGEAGVELEQATGLAEPIELRTADLRRGDFGRTLARSDRQAEASPSPPLDRGGD